MQMVFLYLVPSVPSNVMFAEELSKDKQILPLSMPPDRQEKRGLVSSEKDILPWPFAFWEMFQLLQHSVGNRYEHHHFFLRRKAAFGGLHRLWIHTDGDILRGHGH